MENCGGRAELGKDIYDLRPGWLAGGTMFSCLFDTVVVGFYVA